MTMFWRGSAPRPSPLAAQAGHARLSGRIIFWIEPDRLVVVRDGVVEVGLVAVSGAAVVVGHGIFWIEPDRLVVVRDGMVEVGLPTRGVVIGFRRNILGDGSTASQRNTLRRKCRPQQP